MPTSNTYPRSAAEWDDSTTNQPPFDIQRAATLQTQPAPNWNRLRTDDLLVDAAFVVAHNLPLTPESRATLAGALRSRGYLLTPPA